MLQANSSSTSQLPKPADTARRQISGALDLAERLVVIGLYGYLIVRIVNAVVTTRAWGSLVILPSEGVVVFFMLIRRGTDDISLRPLHWLLAFGATTLPLLVNLGGQPFLPPASGATTVLLGMLLQLHAKLSLGRSIGMVAANRGIRSSGPYRFMRHPMYAGYLLSDIGFLLMNPTLWNVGLYTGSLALQIPRLLVEERHLSHDPAYREYADRVRYRLVPGVF